MSSWPRPRARRSRRSSAWRRRYWPFRSRTPGRSRPVNKDKTVRDAQARWLRDRGLEPGPSPSVTQSRFKAQVALGGLRRNLVGKTARVRKSTTPGAASHWVDVGDEHVPLSVRSSRKVANGQVVQIVDLQIPYHLRADNVILDAWKSSDFEADVERRGLDPAGVRARCPGRRSAAPGGWRRNLTSWPASSSIPAAARAVATSAIPASETTRSSSNSISSPSSPTDLAPRWLLLWNSSSLAFSLEPSSPRPSSGRSWSQVRRIQGSDRQLSLDVGGPGTTPASSQRLPYS